MKKVLIAFALLALLFACSSDDEENNDIDQRYQHIIDAYVSWKDIAKWLSEQGDPTGSFYPFTTEAIEGDELVDMPIILCLTTSQAFNMQCPVSSCKGIGIVSNNEDGKLECSHCHSIFGAVSGIPLSGIADEEDVSLLQYKVERIGKYSDYSHKYHITNPKYKE